MMMIEARHENDPQQHWHAEHSTYTYIYKYVEIEKCSVNQKHFIKVLRRRTHGKAVAETVAVAHDERLLKQTSQVKYTQNKKLPKFDGLMLLVN